MVILHLAGAAGPTSIPADWVRQLRNQGMDVELVTAQAARRKSPTFWWVYLFAFILKTTAKVIHVHHSSLCALVFFASFFRRDVRICVSAHRDFSTLSMLGKAAHLMAFSVADVVTANSQSTYRSIPYQWARVKCRIIYNGVDGERVREKSRGRRFYPLERYLFVGRLIREKNVDSILKAVDSLFLSGRQVKLTIIGNGPELPRLLGIAKDSAVRESVQFLGQLDRDVVYEHMAQNSILLVPSLTEGYCNAAVEAMASGMLVLYSPCPALKEVVSDSGLMLDGYSASAIRQGLESVGRMSESEIESLARRAVLRAGQMDINQAVRSFIAIYLMLLRN